MEAHDQSPLPYLLLQNPCMGVIFSVWTQPTSHTEKPASQKLKGRTQAGHSHTNLSLYRHSPRAF